MALTDIINAITAEAEAELAAIAANRDTEVAAIQATLAEYTATKTAAAARDRQRRADKVAERILAKARHHASFITTGAVQAELEAVFAAAATQLAALDGTTYNTYLEKQWATLPAQDATTGTYQVAAERAEETQAFLAAKGVAAAHIVPASGLHGGFVLATSTREYDCSFRGLLTQLEHTERVTISQKLAHTA
jgi:vacuolar-type H+-ATPase subunit E/Vma4